MRNPEKYLKNLPTQKNRKIIPRCTEHTLYRMKTTPLTKYEKWSVLKMDQSTKLLLILKVLCHLSPKEESLHPWVKVDQAEFHCAIVSVTDIVVDIFWFVRYWLGW